MWIPKFQRDRNKGVDSPMPTQAVSNEEFIPRPQSKQQKQVEHLIGEFGERNAKRLGMKRRDFMRSTMGLATAFWASNQVFGQNWDVDEAEMFEPAAYAEKWPKGEYFIMDVQGHFTEEVALRSRNYEFIRNMGFELESTPEGVERKLEKATEIILTGTKNRIAVERKRYNDAVAALNTRLGQIPWRLAASGIVPRAYYEADESQLVEPELAL